MVKRSALFLFIAVLLWIIPISHIWLLWLDITIFKTLNQSLAWDITWQKFWGVFNHPLENKLGFVGALMIHGLWWGITPREQKRQLGYQLLFFWACFEIVHALKDPFFEDLLGIKRHSPSMVFEDSLKLSELLDNPNIKDTSHRSFPGGHAHFNIFWAILSWKIMPSPYRIFILFTAIFLCMPRLVSGAHWFTDVAFSAIMAFLVYGIIEWMYIKLQFRLQQGKLRHGRNWP